MADKTVSVRLQAHTGQFQTEMGAAARSVQSATNQITGGTARSAQAINGFAQSAALFGKVTTLGVAGGLALSAKAALDFESSFAGIQKTLDATPAQFAEIAESVRQLSLDIPIAVDELNRIGELGGQLGVTPDNLLGFIDTIAKIGVTTNVAVDQAALSFARLANILQVPQTEFDEMGSALVHLGNNFATTEDQVLTFALRLAPISATVGATVDEVLALGTAFSSVGIPAERGGTAIQRVFIEMMTAVDEAGETLDGFAGIARVSANEFATAFEDDAVDALDLFIQGLGEIVEEGGNATAALAEVGIIEQRSIATLLAAASAQGQLTDAIAASSEAYGQFDALTTEAETRFQTAASQITLAKNAIVDLGIEIGENLLPIIGDLSGDFATFIGLVRDGNTPIIELGKFIAIATAGLTAFSVIGGKIIGITASMSAGFQTAAARAALLSTALQFIGKLGVGAIFTVAAIGVGNFISSQIDAKQRVEELVQALRDEREGLIELDDSLAETFSQEEREMFHGLGVSIDSVVKAIQDGGPALDELNNKLMGSREEAQGAVDLFKEIHRETDPGLILPENIERMNELVDELVEVEGAIEVVTSKTNEWKQAQEEFNQEVATETTEQVLQALERGFLQATDAGLRLNQALIRSQDSFDIVTSGAEEATASLEDLEGAAEDFWDTVDENLDTGNAFIDSLIGLIEAQEELAAESDPTVTQMLDLQNAFTDTQRAARELGPNGIEPVIQQFRFMRDAGIITEAELLDMIATLIAMQPAAGHFADGSGIVAANMDLIKRFAEDTGVSVDALVQAIQSTSPAFRGFLGNLDPVNQAISISAQALQSLGTALGPFGGPLLGTAKHLSGLDIPTIPNLAGAIEDIPGLGGGSLGDEIARGISDGGGSTAEDMDDAAKKMEESFNSVTEAIQASLNQQDAVQNLVDLNQELNDLLKEQAELPKEIANARKDLAELEAQLRKEKEEAAKTTLEEQLAIETAQETLARAQLAFKQGLITETELKLAEKAVKDAEKEATDPTSDEVEDLEDEIEDKKDELQDLIEREKEIGRDILDTQLDILDAQINIVDAENRMVKAAKEFNELGTEGLKIFKEMAQAAGLSADQIEGLLGEIPGHGGGSGGGKGTGGASLSKDKRIAQSGDRDLIGDRIEAIFQNRGLKLTDKRLERLIDEVIDGRTFESIRKSLAPFASAESFQSGGIVPGSPHERVPIWAHGGEHIFNPRVNSPSEMGVTIESLNIRGIWDFTNPAGTKRLVDALEDELEARRRGRGRPLHGS